MKYIFLLLTNVLCIKFSFTNEQFQVPDRNDGSILNEIVSNYLHKYLSNKYTFVSIIPLSSNNHQRYYQNDFVSGLVARPKFDKFSYKIVNNIYTSQGAFNLIFIDGSAKLA